MIFIRILIVVPFLIYNCLDLQGQGLNIKEDVINTFSISRSFNQSSKSGQWNIPGFQLIHVERDPRKANNRRQYTAVLMKLQKKKTKTSSNIITLQLIHSHNKPIYSIKDFDLIDLNKNCYTYDLEVELEVYSSGKSLNKTKTVLPSLKVDDTIDVHFNRLAPRNPNHGCPNTYNPYYSGPNICRVVITQ